MTLTDTGVDMDMDLAADVPCAVYDDCGHPAALLLVMHHLDGATCTSRPCCRCCQARFRTWRASTTRLACCAHDSVVTVTWRPL